MSKTKDRYVAAGRCCECGRARDSYSGRMCARCLEKKREYNRRLSARYRARGLCYLCGGERAAKSVSRCARCLRAQGKYYQRMRRRG